MFKDLTKPRRVVITGFGCVTPIGVGRETFWESLKQGVSGVGLIKSFDVSESSVKIAAEVKDFDWEAELNRKIESRSAHRSLALSPPRSCSRCRIKRINSRPRQAKFGVVLGTGGGGWLLPKQYVTVAAEEKKRRFTHSASTPADFRGAFDGPRLHGFLTRSTGCTSSD